MNKILLSVSALLLASAHAESCANSFGGFYAGVQAGMNRTAGDHTVSGSGTALLGTDVLGLNTKHSSCVMG